MTAATRKVIEDLCDELEAAGIIIEDFAKLMQEAHIERSFTLRRAAREVAIINATNLLGIERRAK